jgi:hypothetical protein
MCWRVQVVTISYRRPGRLAVGRLDAESARVVSVVARTKTLLAWSLWLATFGCCAGGLLATLLWIRPLTPGLLAVGAGAALAFPLGYATIGLVLGLRRPANPIGWLYAASGLIWALVIPFEPWLNTLLRDHRPLALAGQLAVVVRETNWAPAIALGMTLPFLLLPDGRLRSRRWRLMVADTVAGVAMLVVGRSLAPGPLTGGPVPVDNPFGLPGVAGRVAAAAVVPGLVLYAVSLPAALICMVLRFRTARGTERQQLRWVAVGAAAAVAGLLPNTLVGLGIAPRVNDVVVYPAVLCVPVAVAVAVLRYRLWDLDRLISRTVVYTVVTALLVVPYLLILPVTTRLAQGAGSLAVAAATLAAAALFQPLRQRVQDLVDRRFNRRRYDAARTVETFAARLREQVDLDALTAELLAVVEQTVAPTTASLWLRPSGSRPPT